MGRIRTVKPEILEDNVTASLSDGAWRLFVSLFLLADDYGNLRANPRLIAGQAFWARPGTDVAALLAELVAATLLVPYTVRGQQYAAIRGWQKHQKVDKPGKPHCPGPDEADASPVEHSRESRESLATVSVLTPTCTSTPTTTGGETSVASVATVAPPAAAVASLSAGDLSVGGLVALMQEWPSPPWRRFIGLGKWEKQAIALSPFRRLDVLEAKLEAERKTGELTIGLLLSILKRYREQPEAEQVKRREAQGTRETPRRRGTASPLPPDSERFTSRPPDLAALAEELAAKKSMEPEP